MNQSLLYHGLISKEADRYCALCVEFNMATEGRTLNEAKRNLKDAVEGYLEVVMEINDREGLIPRHAPDDLVREYEVSSQDVEEYHSPIRIA